jgi:predicted CopG family antitoxin
MQMISFSDRAYKELKGRKSKDETFSDVVLRMIEGRK